MLWLGFDDFILAFMLCNKTLPSMIGSCVCFTQQYVLRIVRIVVVHLLWRCWSSCWAPLPSPPFSFPSISSDLSFVSFFFSDVVEGVKGARFRRPSSHVEPGVQGVLGGWMQIGVLRQREHHCISLDEENEESFISEPKIVAKSYNIKQFLNVSYKFLHAMKSIR